MHRLVISSIRHLLPEIFPKCAVSAQPLQTLLWCCWESLSFLAFQGYRYCICFNVQEVEASKPCEGIVGLCVMKSHKKWHSLGLSCVACYLLVWWHFCKLSFLIKKRENIVRDIPTPSSVEKPLLPLMTPTRTSAWTQLFLVSWFKWSSWISKKKL